MVCILCATVRTVQSRKTRRITRRTIASVCTSQLAGPHENVRREAKSDIYHRCALVTVDGTKQFTQLIGVSNRSEMVRATGRQRALERRRGIPLRASGGHSKAHHLADVLESSMSGLDRTAIHDATGQGKHSGGLYVRNRVTS